MDIKTKFGVANDVQINEYSSNGTYTLGYILKSEDTDKYILLGFDAPIKNDSKWRFWVECGDADGYAETYDAGLSKNDKDLIKELFKGVVR